MEGIVDLLELPQGITSVIRNEMEASILREISTQSRRVLEVNASQCQALATLDEVRRAAAKLETVECPSVNAALVIVSQAEAMGERELARNSEALGIACAALAEAAKSLRTYALVNASLVQELSQSGCEGLARDKHTAAAIERTLARRVDAIVQLLEAALSAVGAMDRSSSGEASDRWSAAFALDLGKLAADDEVGAWALSWEEVVSVAEAQWAGGAPPPEDADGGPGTDDTAEVNVLSHEPPMRAAQARTDPVAVNGVPACALTGANAERRPPPAMMGSKRPRVQVQWPAPHAHIGADSLAPAGASEKQQPTPGELGTENQPADKGPGSISRVTPSPGHHAVEGRTLQELGRPCPS